MRISILSMIAVVACITATPAQDKGAKSDVEKLQVAWGVSSYEETDGKAPDKEFKGWTNTFKGNEIIEKNAKGERRKLGTFSLKEGRKPKEIDIMFDSGKKATGIYELDGDRLTIRIYFSGVARPTAIKGALNKGEGRYEMTRQKN